MICPDSNERYPRRWPDSTETYAFLRPDSSICVMSKMLNDARSPWTFLSSAIGPASSAGAHRRLRHHVQVGFRLIDLASRHELPEVLVEADHAVLPADLHRGSDLERLALPDHVRDGARDLEDLERGDPPFSALAREKPLSDDALQRFGQHDADLLLILAGKHVDDAVDRARRAVRVQGREHEVPRLGRGDRELDRLEVPHFADEDDVGILPQGRLERRRERHR